jgi:type IV secretory pathway TraG/TraD family ATPase VirD4
MKPFVVLGHTPEGDRIRDDQQTSLLTFGSSGSGKTNLLIENALTYEGSFIGLDVTGELAVVTAHRRAEFSDTYLINPYGVFREELAGIPTVRYNPLSCLDPKDDTRFGAL